MLTSLPKRVQRKVYATLFTVKITVQIPRQKHLSIHQNCMQIRVIFNYFHHRRKIFSAFQQAALPKVSSIRFCLRIRYKISLPLVNIRALKIPYNVRTETELYTETDKYLRAAGIRKDQSE